MRTPPPCPAVNTPVANDCLFLKYWLITTSPEENVQLDPKPNRRLYVKKSTIMFSTKELAIRLATQNAPPIRVVIRQPNRVIKAADRWPVRKDNAMATEPTHAEKYNKHSLILSKVSSQGKVKDHSGPSSRQRERLPSYSFKDLQNR